MEEFISKALNSHEGILLLIIVVVVGLNVAMTSLKKFLGWLKDKTVSKADDKAYVVISKILSWSDKALEFASANSSSLPPKIKAELDKKEWKQEEPKA